MITNTFTDDVPPPGNEFINKVYTIYNSEHK